jgi:hypothetical protein
LLLPADETHADAIADLISTRGSLLLPAYEAALRLLATAEARNAAAAAVAVQYAASVAAVTRVGFWQMTGVDTVTPAGSTTEQQQQQQQLLTHLYALQVTCLKCGVQDATQLADQAGQAAVVFGVLTEVASTCIAVLDRFAQHKAAGAGHGNSSSRGSSSSTAAGSSGGASGAVSPAADAAPWVALFARCFCSFASMLSPDAAAAATSDQPDTAAVSDRDHPFAGMLAVDNILDIMIYVDVFPKYLAMAGLSREVQQQLGQQAAAAYEQVADFYDAMLPPAAAAAAAAAAVATSNSKTDAAAAAQQLNGMAQAVIGSISLSTACNNPACSNLAQRSELVLVGGKSCVCARCKAAR